MDDEIESDMMRKKRLQKNTIASFSYQIITVICGFILPRFILEGYGSEVNGLVSSISGFLSIIALLELGMGAVVKSALYKPLSENNQAEISKIMLSAERFFRCVAMILAVYTIVLVLFYPVIVRHSFDYLYTAVLIFSIGISNFMQYYFGMANRLLLVADQRGYIQDNVQSITLVFNTIVSVILIWLGASIQAVKLIAALIYLCRPIVYRFYVNKYYFLDRRIEYQEEPIKQKWNGIAQHLAAFSISGIDAIILSIFGSLSDVSIYAVYSIVLKGIMQLLSSVTNGISALMGELWAKNEIENVRNFFSGIEWAFHTVSVFVWGCTLMLLVPFVSVYINGVNDADYRVPVFAAVITLAYFMQTIRTPYNMMILVAGHYKQTQKHYIIVAVLNVVISILMVKKFGVAGVAIGSFVALFYNTIWTAVYTFNYLVKNAINSFVKQVVVDALSFVMIIVFAKGIVLGELTYIAWGVMALKIVVVVFCVQVVLNLIFYRDKVYNLIKKLSRNL